MSQHSLECAAQCNTVVVTVRIVPPPYKHAVHCKTQATALLYYGLLPVAMVTTRKYEPYFLLQLVAMGCSFFKPP
jgi:hypothetical protein